MVVKKRKQSPPKLEPDPPGFSNAVAHWRNKFLAEQMVRLDAVEVAKHAEAEVERLDAETQRLQGELQIAERTAAHYRQESVTLSAAYISVSESMKPLQKLNDDVTAIALFLRYNYEQEIKEGRHANRTLSDVVTGYLARERQYSQGGWFRRHLLGGPGRKSSEGAKA
jgi:predicted ribosome quality control (RQC) complex YloA/Tae2 family protein